MEAEYLGHDIDNFSFRILCQDTNLWSLRTQNPGFVGILGLGARWCKSPQADWSGGATVVNGGGLAVSRGVCLFVGYHVCIIVSLCTVRRARLQGPTVFSSMALLPYSLTVHSLLALKIVIWSRAYFWPAGTDYWQACNRNSTCNAEAWR